VTAARAAPTSSTRDRIVESALRRFSERGTSAVSMRELADDAGVTVPGLYYHFASKADLIREVYVAHGLGRSADAAPEFPAPGPVVPIGRAEARLEFARMVDEREFLRLMHRESVLGDPDASEVGTALEAAHRERWVGVLRCATDLAPDADLAAAADGIATYLWGLFVKYLNRDARDAEQRIDAFVELLGPALRGATRGVDQ
jgi:AcrR family transcriptional regulator